MGRSHENVRLAGPDRSDRLPWGPISFGGLRGAAGALLAAAALLAGCGLEAGTPRSDNAILRVCDGQAAGSAATYKASLPGPHPIELLTVDGEPHAWAASLPAAWRSDGETDVELVACIEAPVQVPRSPCEVPAVERWAEMVDVRVLEASTARQVDELSLIDLPADCDEIATGAGKATGAVSAADLIDALRPVVLAAALPTPTPPPAPTPTPTPRRLELSAAVGEGAVTVTIQGDGLQAIDLTITPQLEVELEVEIRAGTRFAPAAAGIQTMIAIESAVIEVHPKVEAKMELDVACGEMRDGTPTATDQFGLVAEAPPADLASLLALPDFGRQTFRVKQFAIWTITDNPARTEFVGLQSATTSGGPSSTEIARIKELFTAAGIPLSRYKLTKA
jgi:hypothetical protein